jgi:pimeloyl-ACP methyl ester carboxylesterase
MSERSEWKLYKSDSARATLLGAYEGALARWTESTGTVLERLRLPTDAGETAVFAFGPAAAARPSGAGLRAGAERLPLLLLHGTLSNSSMWMSDAAALSRDRRVFAIDIPGEPGLSEERRLSWEPPIAAAWLAQVVAGLGLARFALLGLSLGGWISLAYATRPRAEANEARAELAALALLCPAGIGRTRSSFMLKAMLAGLRGERGLASLSRSLYGDVEPPPGALEAGKLLMGSTNARMEEPRIYSDEELARISAPLFLAVGSKDSLLSSRQTAARIARLLPEAELLVLKGAGHTLIGLGGPVAEFLSRRS